MRAATDRQIAAGLLIPRLFLGIFLLQWGLEKLVLPSATVRIAQGFYGVAISTEASYVLGVGELILSLALLVRAFRTLSYGLSRIVHTVTLVVSWRQLSDPFGLAKVGGHLWIATWPAWGAFAALFVMRRWDAYTIDGWRGSNRQLPSSLSKSSS
jgi:putative oxidoreductase